MSASLSATVAAAPTATQSAANMLALMAGLSGVVTDYNEGSQVRTLAESLASVVEAQGVSAQASTLQSMVYGAMTMFGVTASSGSAASGTVTFATSFPVSSAPAAPQAIAIPAGTLVSTSGGVMFATTAATTLTSGATGVSVGVLATVTGAIGNVPVSGITGTPLSNLGYPLYVANGAPTSGGAAPASLSQTLALFTAKAASLGLASPVAIANAVIGVLASGSSETVQKAAVYESWLAAGTGAGSGTAGFTVFVDNGTGTASSGLLAAVQTYITGSAAGGQSGYRPAGVPFAVSAVTPVYASVGATGVLTPGFLTANAVTGAASSIVQSYFTALGIGDGQGSNAAQQAQIAADVANAGLGAWQSLTVGLYNASGAAVTQVSGAAGTRVILSGVSFNVTVGS
ncbi:MAG: baseplate J/gp47 family protein [Rhodospirillales bacterium]|nr:baseplate J/gp47 family protein [Rhodospirillales bacterium]